MIGFINVDKPVGMSSAQVVANVKKKLGLEKSTKVGHTGTLDPLASGVLPIAIGKATRLFDFMLSKTKEYVAEFTFGYETDTLDSAGKIVSKSDNVPSVDSIKNALGMFVGEISQIPPQYSAKSVNGKRAYAMARAGQEVTLKPSVVNIQNFELLEQKSSNTFTFKIVCGSGTYIRSLCRDLANAVHSKATMTALKRVQVGAFDIKTACKLDDITTLSILPCEIVLAKLEQKEIDKGTLSALRQGKRVASSWTKDDMFRIYCEKELVGLGKVEDGQLRMKIWLS